MVEVRSTLTGTEELPAGAFPSDLVFMFGVVAPLSPTLAMSTKTFQTNPPPLEMQKGLVFWSEPHALVKHR